MKKHYLPTAALALALGACGYSSEGYNNAASYNEEGAAYSDNYSTDANYAADANYTAENYAANNAVTNAIATGNTSNAANTVANNGY